MRKPLALATLFLALLATPAITSSNVDSDITFDDDSWGGRHPRHAHWAGPLPHPEVGQDSPQDRVDPEDQQDAGLLSRIKRQLWNLWGLSKTTTTTTTAATSPTTPVTTATTTTLAPSTAKSPDDGPEPLAVKLLHPEPDSSVNEISPSPTASALDTVLSTRLLDRDTRSTDHHDTDVGVTIPDSSVVSRHGGDTSDDEDLGENSGDVPPGSGQSSDWADPKLRTGKSVYRISIEVHEAFKPSLGQRNSDEFKKFAESFTTAIDTLFQKVPGKQNSRVVSVAPLSDQFYSKVTIDLGSIDYSDSDKIREVILEQIMNGRIGDFPVKDSNFTFRDFTDSITVRPTVLDCGPGEIACADNQRCIPSYSRCDGVVDCLDSSDENGCSVGSTDGVSLDLHGVTASPDHASSTSSDAWTPSTERAQEPRGPSKTCRGDIMERCHDGSYYCSDQRCDGTQDCDGGEDEQGCPSVCAQGEFVCDLKRCISVDARCDGRRDCMDNTDEQDCPHRDCKEDEFTCNDGSCIRYTQKCDLIGDCPEGEDEHNCYEETCLDYSCLDGKCIEDSRLCDGVPDCSEGEDEQACASCHVGEWQCDDGTCIEESKRCDGKQDCPRDTSDETNNCPTRPQCDHPHQLGCGDGNTCYYKNQTCNHVRDCPNGRDEENCKYCESDQFRCYDGECLRSSQRCDDRADCAEGEDETNCHGSEIGEKCLPGEFRCRNGICITENFRCDGVKDCTDNTDEENCQAVCGPSDVICRDGTCVRESKKCDGVSDCEDGEDERDCHKECSPYEFKCASGECVPADRRCDRRSDCWDGSDEQGCPRPTTTTTTTTTYRPPTQSCLAWEFRCHSGPRECIPAHLQCDRKIDCRDGSDEANCDGAPVPVLKTYPPQQTIKESREVVFQCRDEGLGHIPVRWSREGNQPLPAGSRDHNGRLEMPNIQISHSGTYYCEAVGLHPSEPGARVPVYLKVEPFHIPTSETPACGPDQATCYNRECIPKHKICDGHHDCGDGSDESRCSPWGCEPNEFRCDNRKCVRKSWLCDSDDDCGDGSDERNCERPAIPGSRCHINEFECRSRDQCIPKWFHCDSQNDCQDGSDEIGCFSLKIEQPPPPLVILNQGETFNITCVAIGVPTPIVSWRLNWGHIPAKCTTTSVNGVGVLTCPDVQESDQGAYSCEAMDSRYSIIAQPDTHLQVKIDTPGRCPEGTFNDLATSTNECIKCFCFGATYSCKSANLFVYQLQPPLYPFRLMNVKVHPSGGIDLRREEHSPYQSVVRALPDRGFELNAKYPISGYGDTAGVYPYFPMPENYHGNQLKSYGGYINYKVKFDGPGSEYLDIPDVILAGNNHILAYKHTDELRRGVENDVSIQFFTGNWRKLVGDRWTYATREDIMMALVNLENILIRTQYLSGHGIQTEITGIQMDSAGISNTGQGKAAYVEECQCPAGYTGLSCEECAPGYLRRTTEPQQWLGKCYKEEDTCPPGTYGDPSRGIPCRVCPCPLTSPNNQFGKTCRLDSDSGVTCDCPPGYTGRRCEFCSQGFVGNPLQPGDSCRPSDCDPVGSTSLIPDPVTGHCKCKVYTTGPTCNYCQAKTFHLSSENKYGCISCFCMGVTDTCSSSNWYREELKAVFTRDSQNFKMIVSKENTEVPVNFDASSREIYYDRFEPKVYYWLLPQRFLGDKVTSYGGKLTYTLRYVPAPGGQSSRNTAPDVLITSSNGIQLSHYSKVQVEPDRPVTVTVPLLEQYWQRDDGAYSNREHFLMTLADLSDIMIKATYTTNTREAALISVVLDTATERNTGLARAVEVEQCRCPEGYRGLSCEDCDAGYTRTEEGLYLGLCEPCNCNDRSSECHPDTGECYNCRDNWAGQNCNLCKPGFEERSGRCEPSHATPLCECDPRGSLSAQCFDNRCRCKTNVVGDKCDQCRTGTFNLMESNPEGCQSCYCSGVTSYCKSSNMYIEQIPVLIIDNNHGFTLTYSNRTEVIRDEFDINPPMNEIGFDFSNLGYNRYFWSLPSQFTGDKVTSYGGKLTFTQRFRGPEDAYAERDMDVIITGNGLSLFTTFEDSPRVNEPKTHSVPLVEEHWRRLDARSGQSRASREDMMKVLSNIEAILVRASISREVTRSYLSDVTMDTAVSQKTGVQAKQVEVCKCPPEYKGTSCELCADHYYKDFDLVCKPCPCNGNEDSCSAGPDYRVVCICRHGYTGTYCEYPDDHMGSTVPPPEPPIRPTIIVTISDPTIQIVEAGQTVTYHCSGRSLLDREVRLNWSKQGGYLPNRATTDDREGLLTITSTVESDSGVYVCTATDGYSTKSERVTLTVGRRNYTRPVAVISPSSVDAREGDRVDVQCQASGNPTPYISWRRTNNATINPQARIYDGLLQFPAISTSDSGTYQCMATNRGGTDTQYINIYVREVEYEPQNIVLQVSPTRFSGLSGETVTIHCQSGSPYHNHRIMWNREGNRPLPFTATQRDGVLTIVNSLPDDSGVYVCAAIDSSTAAKLAQVEVYVDIRDYKRPPTVAMDPERQTVPQGMRAEIRCIVTGDNPKITWSKGGEKMPPHAQIIGSMLVIPSVEITDRGIYVCLAETSGGSAQKSALLEVDRRESPQIELYPSQRLVLTEGNSALLQCRSTAGIPQPNVYWTRADNQSLPYSVQVPHSGILRFNSIRLEDGGEYVCHSENVVGKMSATAVVVVYTRPVVQVSPRGFVTLNVGDRLRLECRATGEPTPTVRWEDNRHREDAVRGLDQHADYEISSVSTDNEGTYICIAENQAGRVEERVQVYVKDGTSRGDIPPENPYVPDSEAVKEIVAALDQTTEFQCSLRDEDGSGRLRLEWRRTDGQEMDPRAYQSNGRLILHSVQRSDAGEYSCVGLDEHNVVHFTRRTRLRVSAAPRITLQPTRQTVRPGANPSILCQAEGDLPIDISWEAINRQLPDSVTVSHGLLQFHGIAHTDAGKYVCKARNNVGESSAAAEVIVTDHDTRRPVVAAVDRNVDVYEGNRVTLQCTVQYPVDLQWSKEGGRLPDHAVVDGNSLRLEYVRLEDTGRYICQTRASYGSESGIDYVDLNVIHANPASLKIQPSIDVIHVGDSVDLRCEAHGVSSSEIRWSKPGDSMPPNVQMSANLLRIPDVTSRHAGVYKCSARGPSGYLEDEFVLNVQAPNVPLSDDAEAPITKESSVGQSVVLDCDSHLAPPVSYRWAKRDGPLPQNSVEHEGTLAIHNVVLGDAGMYICTASNGEVRMDKPIILTVTGAIPFFAQAPLSYIALRPLLNSHISFNIELLIKPEQRDGLILYNSQYKEGDGDFLSFGLKNGVPEFRFDVGSGPAIITADEPLRMGEWHHIRLKRDRKNGDMWIDNRGPFSGQSAGQYQGLDLQERLYVGSVPNFTNINKLAGFNSGFVGCISKLKVGDEEDILQNRSLDWVGVTTCETCTESRNVCTNNGVCQEAVNDKGYVCICPRGFSGHDCSRIGEVCYPGACGDGDCEMVSGRHHCKCPIGRAGSKCEQHVDISIPLFSNNAYIAYPTPKFPGDRMKVDMKINPTDDSDGLILYSGQYNEGHGNFISLAIRNRRYEFKFDSGQGIVTLNSEKFVNPGEWVTLTASKDTTMASLGVDSDYVQASLPHRDRSGFNLRTPLYLGGHDRDVTLNREVGVDTGFNGCVSQIEVSGMALDILRSAWNSSNVLDCMSHGMSHGSSHGHGGGHHAGAGHSDPCRRTPCHHGGTCQPSRRSVHKYTCRCLPGYSGDNCEIESDQCETLYPCHNGGSCVPQVGGYTCNCPMGFAGDNCEQSVEIDYDVSFKGDGYIELSKDLLPHTDPYTQETISIDFSTNSPDGLLFWHGQPLKYDGKKELDYLAIAIVDGQVELSYELGSGPGIGRVPVRVDDGKKHKVYVFREGTDASINVDDSQVVKVKSSGLLVQLNTKGNIYIGGTPNNEVMTEGRYEQGFSGCVHRLRIQDSGDIEFGSRALSAFNALPCTKDDRYDTVNHDDSHHHHQQHHDTYEGNRDEEDHRNNDVDDYNYDDADDDADDDDTFGNGDHGNGDHGNDTGGDHHSPSSRRGDIAKK